jgi:hypothetical protein
MLVNSAVCPQKLADYAKIISKNVYVGYHESDVLGNNQQPSAIVDDNHVECLQCNANRLANAIEDDAAEAVEAAVENNEEAVVDVAEELPVDE